MNTTDREKPFEYLRRMSDGTPFGAEIVKKWYIARAFVLSKLTNSALCLRPNDEKHLHVLIGSDSPLMLCVARYVALYAHYLNFKEDEADESRRNRTVISIVSTDPQIKQKLEEEEYLCNLPKYCKYVDASGHMENEDSYIDVELHVLRENIPQAATHTLIIKEQEVNAFFERSIHDELILSIDTSMAYYASQSYALGVEIDNLPSEDIHCAERYARALDVFQDRILGQEPKLLATPEVWSAMSLCRVKEKISNIFCADSFGIRKESIGLCGNHQDAALWRTYFTQLSESEHARWVVEKLILGYRPLNREERTRDMLLTVDYKNKSERKDYRKKLKTNDQAPSHIDICSYADLRRVDPDSRRYDSFLMLAIPKILRKVQDNN